MNSDDFITDRRRSVPPSESAENGTERRGFRRPRRPDRLLRALLVLFFAVFSSLAAFFLSERQADTAVFTAAAVFAAMNAAFCISYGGRKSPPRRPKRRRRAGRGNAAAAREERLRNARYLALRNQINPHFLYNTLEAIRSEAVIGGLKNVADMSESLAAFFRYVAAAPSRTVPLADEIKSVRDYFAIQRFRFGDRIDLRIDVPGDDSVQNYQLPGMILQPVVENAIVHGLADKISGGLITLRVSVTKAALFIVIEDNGGGMDCGRLAAVNRRPDARDRAEYSRRHARPDCPACPTERRGGIAVRNINERIQLLYGRKYGLTYFSPHGIGATAKIALPPPRRP